MENNKIIQELLDNMQYHIEFNGHLSNHIKHAVVAFAGLGVDGERIKAYHDEYVKETTYGYGLEKVKLTGIEINEGNWMEFLGKRKHFSSYFSFFQREEKRIGLQEVMKRYMPVLLKGWVGAFTHATIHLGWGLDIKNTCMILEGLAYMSFSYVPIYTDKIRFSSTGTLSNAYHFLLNISEIWDSRKEELKDYIETILDIDSPENTSDIHPELLRSVLQFRIARFFQAAHPLIYTIGSWDSQNIWDDLYYIITLIYLSKPGNFIYIHLITSLYAMEQISLYLDGEQKEKVVQYYWIGMLGIILSRGEFPTRQKLTALNTIYDTRYDDEIYTWDKEWEHLILRSVEEREEHNAKLVYVMSLIWKRQQKKSIFRVAAGQFTDTPPLPPSFKESPKE